MTINWLSKLSKLRVDRASKTPAPHKPLLLLAIIDQIEEGVIQSPVVHLTPELAFRFLAYWQVVAHRGRKVGQIELPFFYLKSDGILSHVAHPGLNAALTVIRPRSVAALNRVISHAELVGDFYQFLTIRENRDDARQVLINGNWFFPEEKSALAEALGINFEACPKGNTLDDEKDSASTGRDVKFRLQIVPLYRYACALCKLKVLLPNGTTIVEAAHIHAFSKSRNDDITNGMALCRNHHWAFNQGIWTLDPAYRVIVAAGHFDETGPEHSGLTHFHGKTIDFSWLQPPFRPSIKALEWHYERCFLGRISEQ
jgi:putative restriction endonuclease